MESRGKILKASSMGTITMKEKRRSHIASMDVGAKQATAGDKENEGSTCGDGGAMGGVPSSEGGAYGGFVATMPVAEEEGNASGYFGGPLDYATLGLTPGDELTGGAHAMDRGDDTFRTFNGGDAFQRGKQGIGSGRGNANFAKGTEVGWSMGDSHGVGIEGCNPSVARDVVGSMGFDIYSVCKYTERLKAPTVDWAMLIEARKATPWAQAELGMSYRWAVPWALALVS
ncbi:unnamed protein product [Ilex paraguariensis]|uniref:Uncharacterized protein n=1 Tax=Ilex paraguariensis TaxID=185542 RepID=A0ABC8UQ82_9AQUA